MELPVRIATWRKARKLSQRDLAKLVGVSPAAVGLWETGSASPKQGNVEAIAKAMNLSMEEFYGSVPATEDVTKVEGAA